MARSGHGKTPREGCVPLEESMRVEPIESISSMKMIEGACCRAMTKSSRTMREPSPMYFWTSSEPDTRMKQQSVWWATACEE